MRKHIIIRSNLSKMILTLLTVILFSITYSGNVYATELSPDMESIQSTSSDTVDEAYQAYINAVNSHTDKLNLNLSPDVDFNMLWNRIVTNLDSHSRTYDDFNQASVNASGTPTQLVLSMTYYTTLAEEAVLNSIANSFAASLNGKSDYEKIKIVHDYICETITYDEATAVGFRESRSAYDGLVNGSTVCCGYALAFQKIMDTLNIPCRILCGDSPQGPHAWNAVFLEGQWYHLDATWDDLEENGITYDFFLIGQDSLPFPYQYQDMEFELAKTSY